MPAPRRTAKTAPPATDLASALGTLRVSEQGVKRAAPKDAKPVLTLDAVKKSLDENIPLQYVVATKEVAEQIRGDLQRAATRLDCGVAKSVTEVDGQYVIDFQATNVKRKRNYTSAQIRAWALSEHGVNIPRTQKIPMDVRAAFKVAHGFAKPLGE